ncbi:MAG: hypothetical protein H7273_02035 [Polaromonas sp.]|nr:hypothetical protein [Polaromonas sp.]
MTLPKSNTATANTPAQPTAGKGMPAKAAQPQESLPGRQPDARDGLAEQSLELPSDRDEAQDMTGNQVDPHIRQAARDLENGLQDTSNGLETDKAYKKL